MVGKDKTTANTVYKTQLISTKPKGLCLFMKTAKSFDLALELKKIKQNKKF